MESRGGKRYPLEGFSQAVADWFESTFAHPTEAQAAAWPLIREGRDVLVCAPTGSGKTLAAFLVAIDVLGKSDDATAAQGANAGTEAGGHPLPVTRSGARRGGDEAIRPHQTRVLYISPLRSLAADVAVNLRRPLEGISARDGRYRKVRVGVRTGDTTPAERARQSRRPPDILATTPESLGLMLLSEGGRRILSTVEFVIVDELHAVVSSKRGPHLVLGLELLDDLVASARSGAGHPPLRPQRIGLSATQEPIEEMARYLVGTEGEVAVVDVGRFRHLDLEVEVAGTEIGAVCTAERWGAIVGRVAESIRAHRSTMVFVSTRKLAERVGAQLQQELGESAVASHHGSLSKERREEVEARLRSGELAAVVATSSLELGIDVGEVDQVILIGSPRSVTTTVQRVGRSGHALGKVPKGRIFPLTIEELQEACAVLRMVRDRVMDRAVFVVKPLDVLAQQIVAACVVRRRREDELFELVRRAWPYRDLHRAEFDAVVQLHCRGRKALLHRDPVTGTLAATRRAKLHALVNSGTIPDTGEYDVVHVEDGTFLGSLDEDFAIESSIGDVFQLGNSAWRVLRVRQGEVIVTEAGAVPASFPFWFGEAPSRTREVGEEVGKLREGWLRLYASGEAAKRRREWLESQYFARGEAARILDEHFESTVKLLGTLPTHRRLVAERFFDRSGGMQLVLHSPFGSRVNRAFGLALRKKFCRSFGFELQAAAGEDALLISLSTMHSFPLDEAFDFLSAESVRGVLEQAVLGTPLFATRWRWALGCALVLERARGGRKVPINLQRTVAQDHLAEAFPQSLACFETLPPGDIPIPREHPLVTQAIRDCLEDLMDVDGLADILLDLREGRVERVAVDVPEPSPMAEGILSAQPHAFLDDAPLEERRTHAVVRGWGEPSLSYGGGVDHEVAEAVRASRWPTPSDPEELHHCLCWMGFVTEREAEESGWEGWLEALERAGRVARTGGRWVAVGVGLDDREVAEGRLSALGVVSPGGEAAVGEGGERALLELEVAGKAVRVRVGDHVCWADRGAASAMYAEMRRRLRSSFEPVDLGVYEEFLEGWQHLSEAQRLEGPEGVLRAAEVLGGFPIRAGSLEAEHMRARVRGYRPEWLDTWVASGRLVWFRAGRPGRLPVSRLPVCLVPADEAASWREVWGSPNEEVELSGGAEEVYELLVSRGPRLVSDLERELALPSAWLESALRELLAAGLVTGDSFGLVRWLMRPEKLRVRPLRIPGRIWVPDRELRSGARSSEEERAELLARGLLRKLGVVWRERALEERLPLGWAGVRRALRRLEARGEARWGRFVRSGSGEQFALPGVPERLATLAGRAACA